MRVGVVGASGYAGAELLRLMSSHPELDVVLATGESSSGRRIGDMVPALAAVYPDMVFAPTSSVLVEQLDVVFLALPHGESQRYVPALLQSGVQVVDLGADYRLKDPQSYLHWYGQAHSSPELLGKSVYGLVERHRRELPGAQLIAAPGCYPTAASLALGPLLDHALVEPSRIVVNALSGVSGAGRATSDRLHFSRLASNAEAYGISFHRHTPEIEQEVSAQLLFTPHLVPVARGMLVSAYARSLDPNLNTEVALEVLRTTYASDPFVVVVEEPPTMKDPVGSNLCFVSVRVDQRTGWVIAMSSLDNLIKGAAGQAIQAWNVASGRDEVLGLPLSGVTP
ncbi:MAG: N-acetyl-gamma-glutamyl-phosphate reductase [Acidimicrobiaceae bacterium]|nr:N-acetyl-gamma-glutamyl-phosphate reductase [Acidimicrobiaceae bacterium]